VTPWGSMGDDARRLILYVEDDLDHAELVMRGFARMDASTTVVHLTDGEAAIEYLERATDLPDLVLLDLRLPKRDGIEVLARIRSASALTALPVVILTTSNTKSDITRAYEHRVNSYVVKPTDFSALTRAVHDLSHYWTTWNVAPR